VVGLTGQGRGGTATYRAIGPQGPVALRLLEVGEDKELRGRLLNDLERLAAIEHPALRRIYEVGEFGDSLFVAMDLAPDATLAEIVDREGPLAEGRVAAIVEQTADALAALHGRGIVHAEISPSNLFVSKGEEVLLTAPLGGALAGADAAPEELVESEYEPPELAAGDPRSPEADVWGLGAVTYTALTGQPPGAPQSVRRFRPGLSGSWDPWIGRAMATNPAARPAAAELASEPLPAEQAGSAAAEVEPDPGTGGAQAAHPPPPPGEGSSDDRDGEPPRRSFARLGAPGVVVSGEPFDVTLGLAPSADPEVAGGEVVLPDSVSGPYVLTIHLVAAGFALVDGDDWTVELEVTGGQPYPAGNLTLIAEPQEVGVRALLLQALYSVGGQTIGRAVRPIAVRRDDQQPEPPQQTVEPGFEVWLPTDWKPTDLEITILKDRANPNGGLLWTFKTKHAEVETPKTQIQSYIGTKPEAFASKLVRGMPAFEGRVDLYDKVLGLGRSVAAQVPNIMWELLTQVASHGGGRPPSVLLLSEEPYVPWELAVMDSPLTDESPPFLAAQATVGRWVLGSGGRPQTPPPRSADANSIAVVWGKYDQPGWDRLEEAEAEAEDLHKEYEAKKVEARVAAVKKCLRGDPKSDILHFAVHGQYDPNGTEDGIVLVDRQTLDPDVVRGQTFEEPRFVFLNACQVGSGSQVLGDYSGMAEAFLHAGASAVVAPLWSINDGLARKLATGFYRATFRGTPPAAFLRDKRRSFTELESPQSSIHMAYQFFGHPDMLMVRTDADAA
jgi:hypothetical protein